MRILSPGFSTMTNLVSTGRSSSFALLTMRFWIVSAGVLPAHFACSTMKS